MNKPGADRPSAALKQLSALAFDLNTDQPRLDLGPHGARLLHELIAAAHAGLWVSVIILAATVVDVVVHEAGRFDQLAGQAQASTDGAMPAEMFGLSYLCEGERHQLNTLRRHRNALVHYEGASGSGDDEPTLATQAEQAMLAILPVLENLERWG